MCGIAGIIGRALTEAEPQARQMARAQHHRGPDYTGYHFDCESRVALAHNRLSIIDLTDHANQPLSDHSGRFTIIFNGEIYNYIELREQLKSDFEFQSSSDTEVLLYSYIKYGSSCLERFIGMFSFAIWDNQEQTLFAARDRFGVKPFFYTLSGSEFIFSSEIKALEHAAVPIQHSESRWASYLVYGSYGAPDETFFQNIHQLPGGQALEWRSGKLKTWRWYKFEEEVLAYTSNLDEKELQSEYTRLLDESIALRFRSDVPVGFNISGGLDSSTLLAMVNQQSLDQSKIVAQTFYTGNPDYDEIRWVELMLEGSKNPLNAVKTSPEEIPELAEYIQLIQDEPYGGLPTICYARLFKSARESGIIVLLDGQGMDEQWAGYDYYLKKSNVLVQGTKSSPTRPEVLNRDFSALAEQIKYPEPFGDRIQNLQYRDILYTKIPRALRFNDRISMAYSTELREPFLDHRLVELAFSQPVERKIRDGQQKWMLRKIATQFLNKGLVLAPKRPLQTPQREWLQSDLAPWIDKKVEAMLSSSSSHWFDKSNVWKCWNSYKSSGDDNSFYIWQWLSAGMILGK